MNRILTYNQFVNEGSTYSPLDTYKALAFTTARAFNILSYLETIASVSTNNREWLSFLTKVRKEKDLDKKFELLETYTREKAGELKAYTNKRFSGNTGYYGNIFDVSILSEKIPDVIRNLKQASDLLIKDLSAAKIAARAKLIDDALPTERGLTLESLSQLNEGKVPPYDSDILNLIDRISGDIVTLRGVARSIIQVYPESKSYTEGIVQRYLDPAEDELNDIISRKEDVSDKPLSKSLIKAYKSDGWDIKSASDKAMVDLFVDLTALKDEVNEAGDLIRKASNKVTAALSGSDAATQWIEAANSMLDTIEAEIQKKEDAEEMRRKRSSMLPVSDNEPTRSTSTEPRRSTTEEIERLRSIIRGRR